MRPRAPSGKFRRRIELDGTWWAEDRQGAWFVWSRPAADWLPASDPPAIPPPVEPEAGDPWAKQSVGESLREFFGAGGPGRNLLLAFAIVAVITATIWGLSYVWDPFDIQGQRTAFWLFDVFPTILGTAAGIGALVGGIIRVTQGKPFFPPEVRAAFRLNRRQVDRRRELAKALTGVTVFLFLSWWLVGYLKPFGILPIEVGPWENLPPLLYAWLISGAASVLAWTWALRHPRN